MPNVSPTGSHPAPPRSSSGGAALSQLPAAPSEGERLTLPHSSAEAVGFSLCLPPPHGDPEAHVCDPRTLQVEAGGPKVQGHPQPQRESEASLGYWRP